MDPGSESDPDLVRARDRLTAGDDRAALKALERAGRQGKKSSDRRKLEEVALLTDIVAKRTSGSVRSRAERLAYSTTQNLRALERRAANDVREKEPRPNRREWLAIVAWLGVVIAVGIVDGKAFGDALVAEHLPAGDFLLGFVVVPMALGAFAGFWIRARASAIEGVLVAGVGAVLLGVVIASQLDLKPGSVACPSGCEEDVGEAGFFSILAVFLPLAAGIVGAKLMRRRLKG